MRRACATSSPIRQPREEQNHKNPGHEPAPVRPEHRDQGLKIIPLPLLGSLWLDPNYDLMLKYATAIRLGTASTEAILRRFNSDVTHPAYAAMLEVGRAQRTIFMARYLRDRDLQREINAGLNVVENYNGVNDYIFFGKSGELSSNRREEQEISMTCLQILQSCLGYINTLMIQDTLAGPEWAGRLGDADRRGLTPLFTVNMTPYGEIQLNLDRRLNLGAADA
jgi:Tn3 transposase DDE domain